MDNKSKIEAMKDALKHVDEKVEHIIRIKVGFLTGRASRENAFLALSELGRVTPEAFALAEQSLSEYGVTDEMLEDKLEELIEIFKSVLEAQMPELELGHPIRTYLDENKAILGVVEELQNLEKAKFILNPWLDAYERLLQIENHFDRKQNQIFPYLEKKGFDKPTTVMWTLDNQIKKDIKINLAELRDTDLNERDSMERFLQKQNLLITQIKEMVFKEENILFPTALELISDEEFAVLSKGDHEIGFCLIEKPPVYKHGEQPSVGDARLPKDGLIHLGEGLLTVEQIKLIFKHLPVDISFVDSDEVVRFYNDVKHRVFPRSPGVIGRKVQNCHPKESVGTVMKVIDAFKAGDKEHAEFWLELGGKFLHIQYFAVKDGRGDFKGILEVMQDATHVRSLSGSNRLLNWDDEVAEVAVEEESEPELEMHFERKVGGMVLTPETKLIDILNRYPAVKPFLVKYNRKFKALENDMLFKMMSQVADLKGIAKRGGVDVKQLIEDIANKIEE